MLPIAEEYCRAESLIVLAIADADWDAATLPSLRDALDELQRKWHDLTDARDHEDNMMAAVAEAEQAGDGARAAVETNTELLQRTRASVLEAHHAVKRFKRELRSQYPA